MNQKSELAKLFAGDEEGGVVSPLRLITGLFLLCLAVRAFLAMNSVVIGGDAVTFLWGVRDLCSGAPYDAVVKDKLLYQLIVCGVQPFFGDPITAAKAVVVFFSSLTVVFLYPLFKDYFSASVAILAVLLYILHPTINDEHSKMITDSTFTCFFYGALFLFHRYVYSDRPTWEWGYLIGSFVCSVLAIAARPEGALLFGIHTIAFVVLLIQSGRRNEMKWSALAGAGLYVLLPLSAGYVLLGDTFLHILQDPGAYSGNFSNILAVLTGEVASDPIRKWPVYNEAFNEFLELSYYHLNLFLLIGVFVTHWKADLRERSLYLSYFVLYYIAVFLSGLGNSNPYYLNERYFMVGFLLLLPLVAGGIVWTYDWIKNKKQMPTTALVVLTVVLVGLLPRTLEKGVIPRNTENIGLKQSGRWIRSIRGDTQPVILSTNKKVPYYTGVDKSRIERVKDLPHDSLDQLLAETTAKYLIFYQQDLDEYPFLEKAFDHPNLTLLRTFGANNEQIDTTYIFQID